MLSLSPLRCSYGDFAAVSDVVDEATAALLKPEVSDGIVAPGFEPAALEILRAKKGGAFIILQVRGGIMFSGASCCVQECVCTA
jgi:AICAR transformylase/IMP cyclohydrolase PurH